MADQQTPGRSRAAGTAGAVEIVAFDARHLAGILHLCVELRWPSLPADTDRALRALTAPGVTTVVAVAGAESAPVGFAQVLSDGAIQAYLALLAVSAGWRRQGVGRRLVLAGFAASGAQRLDILASPSAERFYRSFRYKRLPGYRVYPHLG